MTCTQRTIYITEAFLEQSQSPWHNARNITTQQKIWNIGTIKTHAAARLTMKNLTDVVDSKNFKKIQRPMCPWGESYLQEK